MITDYSFPFIFIRFANWKLRKIQRKAPIKQAPEISSDWFFERAPARENQKTETRKKETMKPHLPNLALKS
jgi:hypothetical protein